MINPFTQINWNPDRTALRSFGKVVLTGLCIIGALCSGFAFYKGKTLPDSSLALLICAAGGLVIFGLSVSGTKAARAVYLAWFIVGASIGIVISNVLLLLVFYLFFSPYACLLRVFRQKDVLRLRLDEKAGSNWIDAGTNENLSSYFKQY